MITPWPSLMSIIKLLKIVIYVPAKKYPYSARPAGT